MKLNNNYSQVNSNSFLRTKETIQKYAGLLLNIKSKFSAHQKNSEEYSLKISSTGFTTTPIPINFENNVKSLELNFNFYTHKLELIFGSTKELIDLDQSKLGSFASNLQNVLDNLSINYKIDEKILSDNSELIYNKNDAEYLSGLLSQIYFAFNEFKSPILKETSNINFWPHHFDLALLLFSGKLIPGQDPANWSYSREQMNFGFLFGDQYISQPYFYVTIYPFEKSLLKKELNGGAYWYTQGWNGAILELDNLSKGSDFTDSIIKFFNEVRNLAPEKFYKD